MALFAGEVKHDTLRISGLLGFFFPVVRSTCQNSRRCAWPDFVLKRAPGDWKKNIFCNNCTTSPTIPPKKTTPALWHCYHAFVHLYNHPRPLPARPQKISCLSCQGTVLISVMRETPASMAPRRILKPSVKASESSMDPWGGKSKCLAGRKNHPIP